MYYTNSLVQCLTQSIQKYLSGSFYYYHYYHIFAINQKLIVTTGDIIT